MAKKKQQSQSVTDFFEKQPSEENSKNEESQAQDEFQNEESQVEESVGIEDDFEIEQTDSGIDSNQTNMKEETQNQSEQQANNIPGNNETMKKDEKDEKEKKGSVKVNVKLNKNAVSVQHTVTATGQKDKTIAAGGELRTMSNRIYEVPVDCDENINSDDFSVLKTFSNVADSLDVRYIKDGIAAVVPLRHGYVLKDGDRLALLIS